MNFNTSYTGWTSSTASFSAKDYYNFNSSPVRGPKDGLGIKESIKSVLKKCFPKESVDHHFAFNAHNTWVT